MRERERARERGGERFPSIGRERESGERKRFILPQEMEGEHSLFLFFSGEGWKEIREKEKREREERKPPFLPERERERERRGKYRRVRGDAPPILSLFLSPSLSREREKEGKREERKFKSSRDFPGAVILSFLPLLPPHLSP